MTYTEENFKNAKTTDTFEFVCPVCGEKFYRTKHYITRNHGITPKYCSEKCYRDDNAKRFITVKCEECGKEYEIEECVYNRKMKKGSNFFCSRSCAAKYNNRKYPKKEKKLDTCPICGGVKDTRSKVCKKCSDKQRTIRDFELGHYVGYEGKKTYLTHKCTQIRKDARRFMDSESKQEKVCKYCHNHEFDEILEVHHLKGILEFDAHTKISEINCDENLVWLCPNHHTMLEKGLIKLE